MHASPSAAHVAAARSLILTAMALFVVTIAIGILNGLDAVTFDRNQLLTHVHAGTVGWLTLCVVAITFLIFGATDRRLSLALVVCVPVYVLAFYTGNFAFRAVSGVALLAVMFWLVAWTWRAYLASDRSLPQLGVALAITTFTLGGVIGVLLQISFALEVLIVPGDGVGAHAGAMTFGYLVLAGMAVLDWRVLGTTGRPRAGVAQFVALATGGTIITLALLTGQGEVGGMLYLVAELVAVVLFAVRVLPRAVRTDWIAPGAERFLAAGAVWVVVALGLFMGVVAQFVGAAGDPSKVNLGLLVASDHATYIGVITNLTFGILTGLVAARGAAPILGQVVFWGMNAGLAVFAVGLVGNVPVLKQIGAPTMGVCLLVGLALFAAGLLSSDRRTSLAPAG